MGLGPLPATERLFQRLGLKIGDMDVIELNEAFAAQSLTVIRGWGLADDHRVNPNGGAIAIGHPLVCSGARLTVDLVHELRRRGGGWAWPPCVSASEKESQASSRWLPDSPV